MPKRRVPGQELIDQDPQRPPIHSRGMSLVLNNLGRKILGRSTEGIGLYGVIPLFIRVIPQPFGKPEVNQLDMSLLVQQQILRLQIPIGHPTLLFMQILQDQDNLGGVEPRHVLVESSPFPQVAEQFSAGDVVEQEVEEIGVGEGGEEVRDEGVARHVGEDCALVLDVVDLAQFDDFGFAQDFERVDFLSVGFAAGCRADEDHPRESAGSQGTDAAEVGERELAIAGHWGLGGGVAGG